MSGRRLRLGFMTHVAGRGDPSQIVADAVELAVEAERLGYDGFWLAQHHQRTEDGVTASPLPLLAAVAARTERIALGTAVVVLPLEDPRRVAEDAELVDLLSGGRLRLGLGTGTAPRVFAEFGVAHERRHALFAERLAVLEDVLARRDDALLVRPGALSDRLSIATGSADAAAAARRAGHGLLLGRIAFGDEPLGDAQARVVDAYDAAGEGRRELGVTRSVWPAASRAVAVAEVEEGARRWAASGPPGFAVDDPDELARRLWIHAGTPDEIAEALRADRAVARADELIVQFQPGQAPHRRQLEALRVLADALEPLRAEAALTP